MLPASTHFVQRIGHECRDAFAYFFSGYRLQWTCFGSLGSCACALHCTACTFTTTGVAAAASGCPGTASGPSMVLVSKPLLGPVYQQLAWPNMVAAAYYAASGWRLWEYCGLLARDMLLRSVRRHCLRACGSMGAMGLGCLAEELPCCGCAVSGSTPRDNMVL
jgi:hypothetical protein